MLEVCSEEPGRALLVSGILYVFIYENLPGQDTAGMIFHGLGTVRHDLPLFAAQLFTPICNNTG